MRATGIVSVLVVQLVVARALVGRAIYARRLDVSHSAASSEVDGRVVNGAMREELDALDRAFWASLRAEVRANTELEEVGSLARFDAFCETFRGEVPSTASSIEERPRTLETGQTVGRAVFPGLEAKAWWNAADYEWGRALSRAAPAMADELASVLSGRTAISRRRGARPPPPAVWRGGFYSGFESSAYESFELLDLVNSKVILPSAQRFPRTTALLQASGAPYGPRVVGIGRQLPQTRLPFHSDQINYLLTCHVPLLLQPPAATLEERCDTSPPYDQAYPPRDGDSGMAILPSGRAQAWFDGDGARPPLLCDTTYTHSAYNDDKESAAYILFVDIWHPDLTAVERRALTIFNTNAERHTRARARKFNDQRLRLETNFRTP